MHCRQIKKFLYNSINLKSISTIPKTEQLHCCFPKNAKNVKSLKFVPTEEAPKIPAVVYHNSDAQALIAKRIYSLHYDAKAAGAGSSKHLTNRLQNLILAGQPAMNFSTKKIVQDRNAKSTSKHNIRASTSSSHSSVGRGPNSLLTNFMLSSGMQPRRVKSTYHVSPAKSDTYPKRFRSSSRKQKLIFLERARNEEKQQKENMEQKRISKDAEENSAASLELALNIRDKLEDLSMRIKDDLMTIDGTLKAKMNSMKNKFNGGMVQTRKKNYAKSVAQKTLNSRPYHTSLELMPVKNKMSTLEIITEHSKRLSFDPESSIVSRWPKAGTKKLLRDTMYSESVGDGREVKRDQKPFEIKTQLMEVRPEKKKPKARTYGLDETIIGITTKDAADADGVYYARKNLHYV